MVLLGGIQGGALSSLTSIDQWITTLNASVAGAAKTGYKNNAISFHSKIKLN